MAQLVAFLLFFFCHGLFELLFCSWLLSTSSAGRISPQQHLFGKELFFFYFLLDIILCWLPCLAPCSSSCWVLLRFFSGKIFLFIFLFITIFYFLPQLIALFCLPALVSSLWYFLGNFFSFSFGYTFYNPCNLFCCTTLIIHGSSIVIYFSVFPLLSFNFSIFILAIFLFVILAYSIYFFWVLFFFIFLIIRLR